MTRHQSRFSSILDTPLVVNGYEVPVGMYPDATPVIGGVRVFNENTMVLRPPTLTSFMAAMWFVDACAEDGKRFTELILPYAPGARQDRRQRDGDQMFTAKSIAREINARGFDRVSIFDPHSDVMPALIDRCHVVHPADSTVMGYLPSFNFVVAPDAGAEKRAHSFASKLNMNNGVPVIHGWKNRDPATNKLTGFGVEKRPDVTDGARLLIVDDICDGGRTFLGLAAVIRDTYGPNVELNLWVSHGLFTSGYDALFDTFHAIYTTNSVIRVDSGDGYIDDARLAVYNIIDDL